MKVKLSFLLIWAVLALGLAPVQAQDDVAEWTIMFYLAADNDLEEMMLQDINEMESVGSGEDINLVVQMDRAEGYADSDGDWTEARRFYLTQDGSLEAVSSEPVAALGEIFQSDPTQVAGFALWAMQNFPAQKYALIMSDHGSGIFGFGNDFSHESENLSMIGLDQALAAITQTTGEKLELFGFDACLMAQLDIMRVLAPYANYAILAEETEPGFGWSYDVFLAALAANPGMDGAELGRVVVDTYMQFYTTVVTYYDKFDLSVADLSAVAGIDAPMANFVQAVQNNGIDVLRAVGTARNNVQFFGGATPDEADAMSSVDLLHFLSLLGKLTDNADVKAAAEELSAAVSDIVVYSQSNEGLPNAKGVSIFFPRNARIYNESGAAEYYADLLPQMADWKQFLDAFHSAAVENLPPLDPTKIQVVGITDVYPPDEVSIHNPPVVMFFTNGADIASVSFSAILDLGEGVSVMLDQSELVSATYTEDGEQIIDYPDGISYNQFTWNAEMPVVTDGAVEIPVLLLDIGDDNTWAVSGIYTYQSAGREVEAFLHFDAESQEVKSVWGVTPGSEGEAGAPFEIKVTPGDTFLPTWRFIGEGNQTVFIPAESEPLIFGDTPFIFDYAPAESGDYVFTILVEDMAGNLYSNSANITVNNEGLDRDYRGFSDASWGILFLYPQGWAEPYDIQLEDGSIQGVTNNQEETVSVYVNYFEPDSPEAMLDVALGYVEATEGVEYDEPEAITLGGYDGYIVYYYFEQEDSAYTGAVMGVYVPENNIGYLIDVEINEAAEEEGWAVVDLIAETLSFYPLFVAPDTTE